MLGISTESGNDVPSTEPTPAGLAATSLPDDELPEGFDQFMADAYADRPALTDADIDAMWAEDMARRDELTILRPITLPVRTLNPNLWPAA